MKLNKAGNIVFRYGDYGDKFYIIIRGTVSVFVPLKKEVLIRENEDMKEGQNKRIMTEVTKLTSPNSFGDLALIDYKPRAATIKWVDDWIFATIDKGNYQKILGRLQRK